MYALRSGMVAFPPLFDIAFGSPAYADSGGIDFRVVKAGSVVGGSAGSGSLFFHGRGYPFDIGGLNYGVTFGASETHFRGTVSQIRSASVRQGARAIVLTNQNGAVPTLSGNSAGAIVSADLNGSAITVK